MIVARDESSDTFRITFPSQATFTTTFSDPERFSAKRDHLTPHKHSKNRPIERKLGSIQAFVAVDILSLSANSFPPETLDHLYHDHVLPRVLAHQGDLVLHAGGVVLNGRAVAVTADTGRGKSTLTASLHAAGHGILGDDALVVTPGDGGHHVRAVYPSLRLNPDSSAHLFPGEEGRPMAHYSPKRHLPIGETVEEAPLAALFVLGEPADEVSARRLPPAEACMTLIANSFALDPTDRQRAGDKLRKVADLVAGVPVWELRYERDYARLPEVHRLICDLLGGE